MLKRGELKAGIKAMLDGVLNPHSVGHTDKLGRFFIHLPDGSTKELAFEWNMKAPPNIWVRKKDVDLKTLSHIKQTKSPASKLYTEPATHKGAKPGEMMYGRHSNLKMMPSLHMADLVYFTPVNLDEAWQFISSFLAKP